MSRPRLGLLLVLGGSALALALQIGAPVVVPLYDGVPIAEPYRFLRPAAGQPGDPTSASERTEVTGALSPVLTPATAELPPQAQLVAQQSAFELTEDVTELVAEIVPVDPPTPLPEGTTILGNAYRFSVTDQEGDPVRFRPCSGCVTIALRSPENSPGGEIRQFRDGAWVAVPTLHGASGLYNANLTSLGVVALFAAPGGIDVVLLLAIGGVVLIFIAFVALLYLRARPARLPAAQFQRPNVARPASRVPSKRRGPKRPPSGRSDR